MNTTNQLNATYHEYKINISRCTFQPHVPSVPISISLGLTPLHDVVASASTRDQVDGLGPHKT